MMKYPSVFDKTLQKTVHWTERVAHHMGSTDMNRGYRVLRSVLHALRDRLPPDEAVQLGAQMPMLVRGFYYEGWDANKTPQRYRNKQEFLARIANDMPDLDPAQRERAATAVFAVIDEEIGGGEAAQIRHLLPEAIRGLWHEPEQGKPS
jgi:uncharacterized protein (DUF2267 family)